MRLNMLGDIDWESKVDKVLDAFSDTGYRTYFQDREYGEELVGITLVLMCKDPELNLKQRIRLSKTERKLYIDIMLDLPEMKRSDQPTRNRIVQQKLLAEVPAIIRKYKLKDFDTERFIKDFQEKLNSIEAY
jgi:hypothetical protein